MDEFFRELDRLYQTGDPQRVEDFLYGQLRLRETSGDEAEEASILNELSGFYRGVSRYADSCDCSRRAMDILGRLGMGETVQFATMLLNCAGTLRLMGQLERSKEEFLRAGALLEALGETGSYAYVGLLNNLALTCQDMGQTEEAIRLAEQALELVRCRPDREDEVPTSLNNLAAMLLRQENYAGAETRVREALAEFRRLPEKSAHEAAAWGTLGVVLAQTGRTGEAADAFRAAAAGTLAVFGRNVDYASAQRSLSICLERQGDIPGAVEALEDARQALEALLGPEHPRTAQYAAQLRMLRECLA